MEILEELPSDRPPLKVALFDFDGTISTIRQGWESIMEPLMVETISGPVEPEPELIQMVKEYIDQSTGIQTIYQMQWLAEKVKEYGRNDNVEDDPWLYKAEYNRRILELVAVRKDTIISGENTPQDYMMQGSEAFLQVLKAHNIDIYVASGTDHVDVVKEVAALGLTDYFTEIAGAPEGKVSCSKEKVMRELISEKHLAGLELVVIGDGKVEIGLGRELGACTLGVASDEVQLSGWNDAKRARLVKAGAHALISDFSDLPEILAWLGLEGEASASST